MESKEFSLDNDIRKSMIKIKPTTLTEKIVEQVMSMIEKGVFKPGETLPTEMEFSTRLGVGRSSVREALRTLQAVGIIEKNHGNTARFSKTCATSAAQYFNIPKILDSFTLLDLNEARETVEVSLAGLAAKNADDEQIEQIEKVHRKFEKALGSKDMKNIPGLDFEFHKVIAQSSGNQFLSQMLLMLHDLIISGIESTLYEKYISLASEEHTAILEGIKKHDVDRVKKAMKKHMDGVKEKFIYKEGEKG